MLVLISSRISISERYGYIETSEGSVGVALDGDVIFVRCFSRLLSSVSK